MNWDSHRNQWLFKLLTLKRTLLPPKARRSFAQEGEDMILERLLDGVTRGAYVDVGAHHPTRFSNTYHFYRRGWSGMNIDAMPGSMGAFRKLRPRDINLEVGISATHGFTSFNLFNEPALNSFDEELSFSRHQSPNQYKIIGKRTIETHPLKDVLDKHWPADRHIDFMSIDTEGLDLEVLQSNDWQRYRPGLLIVELLDCPLTELSGHPISQFVASHGYHPKSKALNSVIFESSERPHA